MVDFHEQRTCIKFCFKLGKTTTECYEMLKTAFGEQAMCRSQTFQWFSRFKTGRNSTDDDERSECTADRCSLSEQCQVICLIATGADFIVWIGTESLQIFGQQILATSLNPCH